MKSKALPKDLVVFGEVGLAGEIRACPRGQERLKEAFKLGFKRAIIPKANMPKKSQFDSMELIAVDRIETALQLVKDL